MLHRIAADAILVLHFAFVLFVLLGGLVVLRSPRLAWLHLPAVGWAAFVEFTGRICPLTPLENVLRRSAGETGYAGDFVQHYLVALLYPEGLTRATQLLFALLVVVLNLVFYGALLRRVRDRTAPRGR
jgi:uncharacterized membrane protein